MTFACLVHSAERAPSVQPVSQQMLIEHHPFARPSSRCEKSGILTEALPGLLALLVQWLCISSKMPAHINSDLEIF
jgi:hypothetical protein